MAPDDDTLEQALNAPMPAPHCEGPWRESIGVLAFVSVAILGFTVHHHYAMPANDSLIANAAAAAIDPAAIMPVAGTTLATPSAPSASGTLDSNVRLVARAQRTVFNTAASTIRPSVVGIRATFGLPRAGQAAIQRVGSGVVVDSNGFVVTCHHVVAGAAAIVVTPFSQPNAQLRARLLGVQDDLALLQVFGGGPLPAATLADSDQAVVGDWVLAVGHPFGLGLTVTAGIIGRRHGSLGIPGGRQYTGLLQTDAPINEGSSGGPLANLDGQVIGLNTAIYAPTGVFSGAGFAIPSNDVRAFLARHLPAFRSGVIGPALGPAG